MTKILLIEDNEEDADLAVRAFDRLGMKSYILVARDGQEASRLLFDPPASGSQPLTPELILLDLNLPKIPGLEVLRRIRLDPRTEKLPVVILTVSTKDPDLLQTFTMGVSDYLVKPLDPERFVQVYKKYTHKTS